MTGSWAQRRQDDKIRNDDVGVGEDEAERIGMMDAGVDEIGTRAWDR